MAKTIRPPAKLQRALRQANAKPAEPIFGFLGDIDGIVSVPGKPNFLFVTLKNGATVQAYNNSLPPAPLMPVELRIDPRNPSHYHLVGARDVFATDYPYPLMKSHAPSHTWPGYDAPPIHIRQILPGLVTAIGLVVTCRETWVPTISGWVLFAGGSLDISSSVPASGARYVLITISPAGELCATNGAIVPFDMLSPLNVPEKPVGHKLSAAIRLLAGQTMIRDAETNSDILDLRFAAALETVGVKWGSIGGALADQADLIAALNLKADLASLSTVATTGSYTDLLDKPLVIMDDLTPQVDGILGEFELSAEYEIASVYRNGQRLYGSQFSISGTTLTMSDVPAVDDTLVVSGLLYGALSILIPDAAADGKRYTRRDNAWEEYADPPEPNRHYFRKASTWLAFPSTRVRLSAASNNTAITQNVNSLTYVTFSQWWFWQDIREFSQFRIIVGGNSNAAGVAVTLQLCVSSAPTTPISSAGNDLIIPTNTFAVHDSGWIDIVMSSSYSGTEILGLAAKGDTATVDIATLFVEVHFR